MQPLYNQTALGTAHVPHWNRHSVVTGEQQVDRRRFPALRRNRFSQLHFSHQSPTGLSVESKYVPDHFQSLNQLFSLIICLLPKFQEYSFITLVLSRKQKNAGESSRPPQSGGDDIIGRLDTASYNGCINGQYLS